MKKILLLFLGFFLLNGCQKDEKLEYTYSYYKSFQFCCQVEIQLFNCLLFHSALIRLI